MNKISVISRVFLLIAGSLIIWSIFVPIWRIELDAPQYPEGLALLIHANKIGGDVDIINGLNHYIGMQTLHTENFIEFTLLPYILGAFALFSFLTMGTGNKKLLYTLLITFFLFGVLSMVDFYRWNYNYGHNLDPHAAIIVPGMSYQPPLIGYKQLLNFAAFSTPDLGGWFLMVSGIFVLWATTLELRVWNWIMRKFKKSSKVAATTALFAMLLSACANGEPEPIKLNKDNCDFCKMTITDGRFGAELITEKGRVYKFDDLSCLVDYRKENTKTPAQYFFVHNYLAINELITADKAFYVVSEQLNSPMRGNAAAFLTKEVAVEYAKKLDGNVLDWAEVNAYFDKR